MILIVFIRTFRRRGGGTRHQRRVQNMEEKHAVPVRPRNDPRARMAFTYGAVAAGRDPARGQGLFNPPADSWHAHLRRAEPPADRQRAAAKRGRAI